MTVKENMKFLEERVKKAVAYINKLRAENDKLKDEIESLERDIKLITNHNQELQNYVDTYKEDEQLINASIQSSLDSLNDIGLDNLALSIDDLETAEAFSAIGGDSVEELDVSDMAIDF